MGFEPKSSYRWALLAALLLAAPLSQGCSNGSPQLRVGFFDFPPLYYRNAQGAATGELIALLDQVTRKAGCTPEYHYFNSVPQLMEKLVAGHIDLCLMIRHPLLEARAHYGNQPLTQIHLNLYRAPDAPDTQNLAALSGQRLIVIRGYGYAGLANTLLNPESGITLIVADDHLQAFKTLLNGGAEYLLGYQEPAATVLAAMGIESVAHSRWGSRPVYLISSPELADPERLLADLERAAQALRQAGLPND